MGKRSTGQFERRKNDLYRTWDRRAVVALLPHLATGTWFAEPCAGDGVLADQLVEAGHHCAWMSDIAPGRDDVAEADAMTCSIGSAECFISNPPWTRAILHPLIERLSDQAPTWLLFDADWAYTKQAARFMPRLRRTVAVGRLRWIEGSTMDGKDNCSWYLFDRPRAAPSLFFGRVLDAAQGVAA